MSSWWGPFKFVVTKMCWVGHCTVVCRAWYQTLVLLWHTTSLHWYYQVSKKCLVIWYQMSAPERSKSHHSNEPISLPRTNGAGDWLSQSMKVKYWDRVHHVNLSRNLLLKQNWYWKKGLLRKVSISLFSWKIPSSTCWCSLWEKLCNRLFPR